MNIKDFDFKKFFLQRGEWVGLGVALAIMLPALYSGTVLTLTSGSATKNAEEVKGLAKAADNRIASSQPPADADKPPPESELMVRNDRVEPEKYTPDSRWFVPSTIEDTKRRAPVVLPPGDFQVAYVRGGMKGYIFTETKDKVLRVLVIKEKQAAISQKQKDRMKRLQDYMKKMGMGSGAGGMPGLGGGMGMGGGKGGGGMGGVPPPGGGERGGQEGGGIGGPSAGGPKSTYKEPVYVDVEKLGNNETMAEELVPVRMVIVTGTFPIKRELEAFRIALRKRTLNDLVSILETPEAKWEFAGLEIQRRVLRLDGQVHKDWEKHDGAMRNAHKAYLARATDAEKEDPELGKFWGLMNKGLIWARPALVLPFDAKGESRYPKTELTSLKEAIAKLEKEGTETTAKMPSRLTSKFKGNFDPENPADPLGAEEESKSEPEDGMKPPEDENKDKSGADANEPVVPEKALVRFIDLTVEPGYTYEYRVRVKMVNPNYKMDKEVAWPALAKNKFIEGDWTPVPPVTVPFDVNWYVTDERGSDRERLNVQIQKWVDIAHPDPTNQRADVAVADWSVLEKSPAATCYRGDYIGRKDFVEIPTWSTLREEWEFARGPKRTIGKKISEDFTVKLTPGVDPTLLVDYDGGKQTAKIGDKSVTDESAVRVLFMTGDGKLEIRTNQEDINDQERKDRHETWKKRVEDVKNPKRKGPDKMFEGGKGPAQ